jgi:hypothetical protein
VLQLRQRAVVRTHTDKNVAKDLVQVGLRVGLALQLLFYACAALLEQRHDRHGFALGKLRIGLLEKTEHKVLDLLGVGRFPGFLLRLPQGNSCPGCQ